MLGPDDRSILREQLRPEPGDELDMAVATTFSLDLTSALVAPLAFSAFDLARTHDPIAVLESIRSVTEKIDIFCQVGQLRVPAVPSDLMAFLERMVHPVQAPVPGFLFHPKLWILRYRTFDDGHRYRLLCGTRNLTGDVSWDALVRLDGEVAGGRSRPANRPLVELVQTLPDMVVGDLPQSRRDRVKELADDLRQVEWERPEDVYDVAFHALGLRRGRGPSSLAERINGRRHLVVSPFLDDEGLAAVRSSSGPTTLVSRSEAMERLDPAAVQAVDCHVINSMAGLRQPDESDEAADDVGGQPVLGGPPSLLGGLHAKVYVVDVGHRARIFVGSSNATTAGLNGRNVEFVIEMEGKANTYGVERFLGPDAAFATILEPYTPTGSQSVPDEETVGRRLENLLRSLAATPVIATVTGEPGDWTEHLSSDAELSVPAGVALQISLLTTSGRAVEHQEGVIDAAYSHLVTADITPFVVLRVSQEDEGLRVERATVMQAELVGDPGDRLDAVIARQVDTPEEFLRFLVLLLGLADDPFIVASAGNGSGRRWVGQLGQTGVLELLVRAVADRPAALDDLDTLVEHLRSTDDGRSVLPDGFDELWTTVRAAQHQLASST